MSVDKLHMLRSSKCRGISRDKLRELLRETDFFGVVVHKQIPAQSQADV